MQPSKALSVEVSLPRLLKRQQVAELLSGFQALLPGCRLALVQADGRLFAGTGNWPQAELAACLAQAADGQPARGAGFLLRPLLVRSRLFGALVAGDTADEHVLNSVYHSLALLLAQAIETRELVRETLDRYREINLLYNIGDMIGNCLDPNEIAQRVLGEANRILNTAAGLVLLPARAAQDGADFEVQAIFGAADYASIIEKAYRPVAEEVFRGGRPAIITGLPGQVGPALCAPLKTQDRVLGAMLLGRPAGQPEFTAGDEKLLMALAGQAAIAIERARLHQEEIKRQRMEEELAIGRQIQLSLLPDANPTVPGWEFAALYQPARLVGGDLYDFLELPGEPRRLGLVIADVTDKGVPAALFMAFGRTVIRIESTSGRGGNPASALTRANRYIVREVRSDSRLFMSAFYATLETYSGRLAYANAGHNWPLWVQAATGQVQPLDARGMMLGIFPDIELEEREIVVNPGDLLIFYTDGVTEAKDTQGQLFDDERLRQAVAANPEASAQQTLESVVEAVRAFTGDAPPSDDLTLFVVKRERT